MDKKPIAFSGSHWRVNLGEEPDESSKTVNVPIVETFFFNYAQGLLTNKYPIEIKALNPSPVAISGKLGSSDYIEIVSIISDYDGNRFLCNSGDTIRFVMKTAKGQYKAVETVLDYVVDSDFTSFSLGTRMYGFKSVKKRIYAKDIPGSNVADLLVLGVNVKQGGAGNEYVIEVIKVSYPEV